MMTPAQCKQWDALVDSFWAGDCGQVEFFEVGTDLGASLDQINRVLEDVLEEDGVL